MLREIKRLPKDSCSVLYAEETLGEAVSFRAARAVRFFKKVLKAKHKQEPRVINVDKNAAYPAAIEELKKEGILSSECELRQNKYLNNIVEQDHRFPKKLAKYKSYFQYFHTAW